jgi:hypothetical protein
MTLRGAEHQQQSSPSRQARQAAKLAAVIVQVFPRLVGVLFAFRGIQKIVSPEPLYTVLRFEHVPERLLQPITATVISVEILLGLLLIIRPHRRWVLGATMGLLIVYTVQILYLLIAHDAPSCGCLEGVVLFESARRENLLSLIRNLCLILPTWWTWLQLPLIAARQPRGESVHGA